MSQKQLSSGKYLTSFNSRKINANFHVVNLTENGSIIKLFSCFFDEKNVGNN